MTKRTGKLVTGRAPRPDERQVFRVDTPPAQAQERIAAHDTISSDAKQREQAGIERRGCRATFELSIQLGKIIDAWRRMREMGDTAGLSRESLRRIDMHVALADPAVLDHLRRANADAKSLMEMLDQETQGSVREMDFEQRFEDIESAFGALDEFSEKKGYTVVEQGANDRTEREHRAIRLSAEIALKTNTIRDFLYVLDSHIRDRELTHKLTQLEIARLNDQLHRLLRSRDWPHPTQEMAQSFTAWEDIFRDATHGRYTYILERAQFQKDPTTTAEKPRRTPSFWENVVNAPSDIGKMIFDEDGARTGK